MLSAAAPTEPVRERSEFLIHHQDRRLPLISEGLEKQFRHDFAGNVE